MDAFDGGGTLFALVPAGGRLWVLQRGVRGEWRAGDPADEGRIRGLPLRQVLEQTGRSTRMPWYEACAETAALLGPVELYCAEPVCIDALEYAFLTHVGAVLSRVAAGDARGMYKVVEAALQSFVPFAAVLGQVAGHLAVGALLVRELGQMRREPDFGRAWQELSGKWRNRGGMLVHQEGGHDGVRAFLEGIADLSGWLDPPDMGILMAREQDPEAFDYCLLNRVLARGIRGEGLVVDVVGTQYQPWASRILQPVLAEAERRRASSWFEPEQGAPLQAVARFALAQKVCVQAEPYNPHDPHALAVLVGSAGAGQMKAGYLSRTLARAIRLAMPETLRFEARIERIHEDGWNDACFAIRLWTPETACEAGVA